MAVDEITEVTPDLVEAMRLLTPQLSRSAPALTAPGLQELIDQPGVYLFAYRLEDDGPILGVLTLATFKIPTGLRAWIEDVVVDSATRGQGAGQALVMAAIDKAHEIGSRTVDLTSRPTREAANRLYQRCGFALRETNVYRYAAS